MPLPRLPGLDVQAELQRLQELEEQEKLRSEQSWLRTAWEDYGDTVGLGPKALPFLQDAANTPLVRGATQILGGASDLVGAGAAALRSRLAGLPNPVELTEEGREKYGREAFEAGATGEEFDPLTIDLTGRTFDTPGAGKVAVEGLIGAGQHALEATAAPWRRAAGESEMPGGGAYDPSTVSGLRALPPGPAAAVAKVGEVAGGFALDLPFDPVELRVARTATGLARAEQVLGSVEEVAEAERAHRQARKAYQAAEDADWWSAAVALPGTAAGTLQSAGAAKDLVQERGLGDPEAAGAVAETLLSGAFTGSMLGSVARPQPHPATTEQLVGKIRSERAAKKAAIRAGLDQVVDGLAAQQQTPSGPISAGGEVPPALPQPAAQASLAPSSPLDQDLASPEPEELPEPSYEELMAEPDPLELVDPEAPFEAQALAPEAPPAPEFAEDFTVPQEMEAPDAALTQLPSPTDPAAGAPGDPLARVPGGELGEVLLDPGTQFFVDNEPQEIRLRQTQPEEAAAPADAQAQEAGSGGVGVQPPSTTPILGRGPGGEEAPGVVQEADQAGGGEAQQAAGEVGAVEAGGGGEGVDGGAGEGLKPGGQKWMKSPSSGKWYALSSSGAVEAEITQTGSEGYQVTVWNPEKLAPDTVGVFASAETAKAAAQVVLEEKKAEQAKAAAQVWNPPVTPPAQPEPRVDADGWSLDESGVATIQGPSGPIALEQTAEGDWALYDAGDDGDMYFDTPEAAKTWVKQNLPEAGKKQPAQPAAPAKPTQPAEVSKPWQVFSHSDPTKNIVSFATQQEASDYVTEAQDETLDYTDDPLGPTGQKALEPADAQKAELSQPTLQQIAPAAGGNPGGLYKHPNGKSYYVKPSAPARVASEVLANALYRLAGLRVPTLHTLDWDGGKAVASEIIPDLKPVKGSSQEAPGDAWRGFGMDAWLANWDVVGIPGGKSSGNLYRASNGQAVRIDQGGALLYRGMGKTKGAEFGPKVGEIETLRDPSINPEAAKVFGSMSPQQLYTSLKVVSDLSPQDIGTEVSKLADGFSPKEVTQLITTLLERQKYVQGKMGELAKQLKGTGAESGWLGGLHTLSQESVAFTKGGPPSTGATPALIQSFSQEQTPTMLLGNIAGKEPPLELELGQKATAGVVILEPDGRVWLRENSQGQLTLSKGNLKSGEHPAQGAVRETWEESGLSAEPLNWLGDFERSYGQQRMYIGRRVGGDPSRFGSETKAMHLVPLEKALGLVTKPQDKLILQALQERLVEAQASGHGDLLSGLQALAGKPKPPKAPPSMKLAHFHTAAEASELAKLKDKPAEWKSAAEKLLLKWDPQANLQDLGGKPSLPSWMQAQADEIEALAGTFKTQKALKEAIQEAKENIWPQTLDNLQRALAFKKLKDDTQILRQWFQKQVKLPTFKKWWRKSKVIDSKGLPLPVFHGTTQVFGDFDPSLQGTHHSDPNDYFGFYFSPHEGVANGLGGSKTLAAVLAIQNPYLVTVKQMASFEFPGNNTGAAHPSQAQVLQMKAAMQALGYDGIRVVGSKNSSINGEWYWDQWVPFRPDQIHAITHPQFKKKSAYVQNFIQGLQKLAAEGKQVPLLSMAEVVAQARASLLHTLGTKTGSDLSSATAHDLGSALFHAARLGVRSLAAAGKWAQKHLGDLLTRVGGDTRALIQRAWTEAKRLIVAHQSRMADLYGPAESGAFKFGGGAQAAVPQPNPPGGPPQQGAPPPNLKAPKVVAGKEDKLATARAGAAFDAPPTGEAKGKPTGTPDIAPNLERLGLSDDQTKRLRALMEEIQTLPQGKGGLDRAKPEHWEDLDHTIKNLLRVRMDVDWRKVAASRNLRAAEVQAFKTLVMERAVLTDAVRRKVEAAAEALALGKGSQEEVDRLALDYMAHKLEMVANLRAFANDGTAAARALAARRRVMAARTDFEKSIGVIFKTLGSEKAQELSDPEIAQLATLVQETLEGKRDEASLLNALIAAQRPATWSKIMEAWKAGLLSGIPTKIANNLGNSTNLLIDLAKDPIAGAFDWARNMGAFGLGKGDRSRYISDMGAALSALRTSLPGALRDYRKAWVDATLYRPESVEVSYERGLEGHLPSIGGKLGRFVRSPFRKLQAADDLFKTLFRGMETAREANRLVERWISKGKVPRAQKGKVLEALLADIYSPEGPTRYPRIAAAAERAAVSGTFQDKPGPTGARVEAVFKSPLGKYLQVFVPFLRTPMNIGKATLKLTPAGVLLASARMKGLLKTTRTPDQLTDDMARALLGTIITTTLIAVARAGFITGSGPSDDDERKLLLSTGWRPNSLVVPYKGKRHYIPVDRFEPLGTLFGIAGDLAELKDLEGGKALFQKGLRIAITQGLNKTYFEGVNNALELFSDPNRYGTSVLRSLGGSVVPALVAGFARGVDPVFRETAAEASGPKGLLQAIGRTIQARVPFASKSLPAKRTATGASAERGGNFLSRFALPTTISPRVRKPVEEELLRIGYAPGPPKRETTVQGRTIRLTDREYREVFKAREKAATRVRALMLSPRYQSLPLTEEEGGSRSREALVRRIYADELTKARKAAYKARGPISRTLAPPPPRAVFR